MPYVAPHGWRRKLFGPLAVALHRAAMPVGAWLTSRPRRDAQDGQIHIMLEHAWGMGGMIRTSFNLASHLSERGAVEIVSARRAREESFLPFPPGVSVTALDDRTKRRGPVARLLGKLPSVL